MPSAVSLPDALVWLPVVTDNAPCSEQGDMSASVFIIHVYEGWCTFACDRDIAFIVHFDGIARKDGYHARTGGLSGTCQGVQELVKGVSFS